MTILPTLVVVGGPPGAGKTSLAHALAAAIPCPALCRDEIKEGMAHAAGGDFQGSHGDPLTQRTFPLFFDVLRVLLEGGVTVVAEAAFQDPLWRRGLEPLTSLAELRLVHCTVDASVARERAARRAVESAAKRQAHGDSTLLFDEDEWRERHESFDRLSLDAPAVEVDTTDGYRPALAEVVAFVSARPPVEGSRAFPNSL